jgi:hypothetical protein
MALKIKDTGTVYGIRQKLGFEPWAVNHSIKQKCVIRASVVENPDRNYYRIRNICILSNSQAAIEALSNNWITSKLVWNFHQCLIQLAEHNRVQLIWMPVHEGTNGNEMVE